MNFMNFENELEKNVRETEDIIACFLPKETGYQKRVIEAMNYSILAGGKRLRPILMRESFRLHGGEREEILEPFMAALEMIHTYSLVHDDLPDMDNDDYRRGKLTTHKKYDPATAILAGDGLLNLAFETAALAFLRQPGSIEAERAFIILGNKAGIFGMVGGQTADIEAEGQQESVTRGKLLFIHEKKTAALIQSALMIGAVLAGADDEQIAQMEKVGYNIGIAFQIQDDILDVTGTTEQLGKPVGSDEKNHKVTYVSLEGLEKAKKDVFDLSSEAIRLLQSGKRNNEFLIQLVENLITRQS